MNGKEAEPYAIRMGILEFSANPRPKYIVNITQMIPMITYSFVIKEISLHRIGGSESNGG